MTGDFSKEVSGSQILISSSYKNIEDYIINYYASNTKRVILIFDNDLENLILSIKWK